MLAKSFDIDTAKEIVGDQRMRSIEAQARNDANAGKYEPPPCGSGSYWSQVSSEMDYLVYINAHQKRVERMKRMDEQK